MTAPLSIVEASIEDLQQALSSGQTNSVELVAKHLHRIARYDRRGLALNSIPVFNLELFEDAAASDERRAVGTTLGPLDGIPCTVKDSYKIKGMTVASGSPEFRSLIANEDAFAVRKIKNAGGIIMGKTNMPPMAAGGMQRGTYGRAESPYNKEYLTAAFASGSSNGSATATAASFGVFGMAEETLSSGRSPASNNGLVAYTPSRGVISIRGNWPLFPTCDVIVPHTRTVRDMFSLLDVIVAEDDIKTCDFWREQQFIPLPDVHSVRPQSYHDLADSSSLAGKRIGVPNMYIGGHDPAGQAVQTRESVIDLWKKARETLQALGASVTEVDFPAVSNSEKVEDSNGKPSVVPANQDGIDLARLMAYAWDDFLVNNADPTCSSLATVNSANIFPPPPGSVPDRYADSPLARHADLVAHITNGRVPTFDIPGLGKALQALEDTRKSDFEDWLDQLGLDFVVFPCNGDVGAADSDVNELSSEHAWQNGVLYSNGNSAIRQLGIPTVSVTMGIMNDTKMPVNLTFASKAYDDSNLFRYVYAFESASKERKAPGLTPPLPSDEIRQGQESKHRPISDKGAPRLTVDLKDPNIDGNGKRIIKMSGLVEATDESGLRSLSVYVDGEPVTEVAEKDGKWSATAAVTPFTEYSPHEIAVPEQNQTMITVLASGNNGRSTGKLLFV